MLNGSQTIANQLPPEHPTPAMTGKEDSAPSACPPFVAVSAALRRLLLQAEIASPRLRYAAIEGEAGTGKHLFAQTLHRQSAVATLPFRRRDAREWLATEADASALSGTLYLDRIDLLAPAGQGLLLHFVKMLQSSDFPRPGQSGPGQSGPGQSASSPDGSDADVPPRFNRFLLLVSSHSSLRQLASQGHFLPDLAFRLSAVRFPLPPLRDHREDIAPITQALIDRICRRYKQPTAVLAPGTLPRLLQHSWPGNVRELASMLESTILDSTSGILRPMDFEFAVEPATHPNTFIEPSLLPQPGSLANAHAAPGASHVTQDMTLDAVIQRHIQRVLDLNRGNKLRAARQLGISRSTLYRILAGETISAERKPQEFATS